MNALIQKEPGKGPSGFTLIELLVVIAVIALLASLVLPALGRAKQKAIQTSCLSNLKQVGVALQMYIDDNENVLPGPVVSGARASYDRNSSMELVWYLANDLGSPPPLTIKAGSKPVIADVFVCPGYLRYAPGLGSMEGRKCYLLNDNVNPDPNNRVPPFGYPDLGTGTIIQPLNLAELEKYSLPANTFAMTDVDKINVPNPTVSWWADLPYQPVHGQVRNELYFDLHVAAKALNW